MAAIALTLYIAFGALALGGRLWMQWSRTGSTGYRRNQSQSWHHSVWRAAYRSSSPWWVGSPLPCSNFCAWWRRCASSTTGGSTVPG